MKRKERKLKIIQDLRNKKFEGIMDQYGLTEEQLNDFRNYLKFKRRLLK